MGPDLKDAYKKGGNVSSEEVLGTVTLHSVCKGREKKKKDLRKSSLRKMLLFLNHIPFYGLFLLILFLLTLSLHIHSCLSVPLTGVWVECKTVSFSFRLKF